MQTETVQQPHEAAVYWLSFCDPDRPTGQQFLGACIVTVTPEDVADAAWRILLRFPHALEGAEYVGAAVTKAHALGCNPGGEVASMRIDPANPMLQFYRQGVLMDRATIERIDAEIAESDAATPLDGTPGQE